MYKLQQIGYDDIQNVYEMVLFVSHVYLILTTLSFPASIVHRIPHVDVEKTVSEAVSPFGVWHHYTAVLPLVPVAVQKFRGGTWGRGLQPPRPQGKPSRTPGTNSNHLEAKRLKPPP